MEDEAQADASALRDAPPRYRRGRERDPLERFWCVAPPNAVRGHRSGSGRTPLAFDRAYLSVLVLIEVWISDNCCS